mmetsp:Transcript_788/g.1506  ORF Transcript_788/g.1506 Transcript_788/m.1506 type:complete len:213 (+) Transcript_788:287-925(+)
MQRRVGRHRHDLRAEHAVQCSIERAGQFRRAHVALGDHAEQCALVIHNNGARNTPCAQHVAHVPHGICLVHAHHIARHHVFRPHRARYRVYHGHRQLSAQLLRRTFPTVNTKRRGRRFWMAASTQRLQQPPKINAVQPSARSPNHNCLHRRERSRVRQLRVSLGVTTIQLRSAALLAPRPRAVRLERRRHGEDDSVAVGKFEKLGRDGRQAG